jgi:RAB protein geranylgeranyltransferase component A
MEALSSPLMGFFEKRRAKNFFAFLQNYDYNNPATQQGNNAMFSFMKIPDFRALQYLNLCPYL